MVIVYQIWLFGHVIEYYAVKISFLYVFFRPSTHPSGDKLFTAYRDAQKPRRKISQKLTQYNNNVVVLSILYKNCFFFFYYLALMPLNIVKYVYKYVFSPKTYIYDNIISFSGIIFPTQLPSTEERSCLCVVLILSIVFLPEMLCYLRKTNHIVLWFMDFRFIIIIHKLIIKCFCYLMYRMYFTRLYTKFVWTIIVPGKPTC